MRWIQYLASAAVFSIYSSGSLAQDAYTELAQMMGVQQTKVMQGMFNSGMMENMQNSMRGIFPGGDSEKAKAATEKMRPSFEKFKKNVEAAALSTEMQTLMRSALETSLRKVYTAEEAQAQINFFRSPQGASILEKSAALTTEVGRITPQIMQTLMAGPMGELMEDMKTLSKEK